MRKIEHKEAELAQQRTKHQDKVHEIRALEQTLAELTVSRVFVPHAHHTGSARTQTGSPPLDGPTASCAPFSSRISTGDPAREPLRDLRGGGLVGSGGGYRVCLFLSLYEGVYLTTPLLYYIR